MSNWSIQQWEMPEWLRNRLDERSDQYRITMSGGWRIVWLGYDRPDKEPLWIPVAWEKVTIHGK